MFLTLSSVSYPRSLLFLRDVPSMFLALSARCSTSVPHSFCGLSPSVPNPILEIFSQMFLTFSTGCNLSCSSPMSMFSQMILSPSAGCPPQPHVPHPIREMFFQMFLTLSAGCSPKECSLSALVSPGPRSRLSFSIPHPEIVSLEPVRSCIHFFSHRVHVYAT
jgi:hypothetical protein